MLPMHLQNIKIILAQPRGFCAGVERAIDIVEKALEKYGAPIYVRHEIVHNKYVVNSLKEKGVVFVKEVEEIPDGAITIFSAHGISEKVENEAKLRDLPIIDATCPLVTKVHKEAQRHEQHGAEIILIGHKGHPEVEGTSGRVKQDVHLVQTKEDVASLHVQNPNALYYVTQTTLSVDDTRDIIDTLKARFPTIQGPELKDICYATTNRQDAVKELAKQCNLILVIGAQNSSNSNRLRDLAEECNIDAYLINGVQDINDDWLQSNQTIGITAGASAPEILVQDVIHYIQSQSDATVTIMDGKEENIKFKLPKEVV